MVAEVHTLLLRVPRRERSYVHWILEAHEGLATLTEPEDADGDLVISVPATRRHELDAVLEALAREVPLLVREAPVS